MHPAERGRLADSAPPREGAGLLRGLVQGTGRRLLCFQLPRVHAVAQSAQMPSGASTGAAPAPNALPTNIGKPEFPETGWERLKELFDRHEKRRPPEELLLVAKCGAVAALAGFVYGGYPAARFARQRYIQVSQAEVYATRAEAVRSAHNAAIRGFLRYGWRWGWRVSLIVTLLSSVSTGLSVYRDKDVLGHYAAAGAVAVGLFRANLGPRGLAAGSVIGAALGIPVGAVAIGLQTLTGESIRERRRRERRELYEHKLKEWAARLQMTDELIASLSASCREGEAQKDLSRIQELVSLPRNEVTEESSSSSGKGASDVKGTPGL